MKLLSNIRSRSKNKTSPSPEAQVYTSRIHSSLPSHYHPPRSHQASYSSTKAARLPTPILFRIFSFVCPHARDTSYDPLEESTLTADASPTDTSSDACMLCDMRDLAHCALVCRGWTVSARELLYTSVRIDPVHYCTLEHVLAEQRKHHSFFNRNAEPRDAPKARLQLFSRSVRAKPEVLGILVEYLKMPYMTRETCKADLARTVSVLPNLRYVDLPEGFFSDDPGTLTLRQELRARCPEIRKIKFSPGGEASFALLAGLSPSSIPSASGPTWAGLEVLDVSGLNIEATSFLRVLAELRSLHDLRLSDLPWLDDSVFDPTPSQDPQQALPRLGIPASHLSVMPPAPPGPSFPPLTCLTLTNTPNLTAEGLASYLYHSPHAQATLSTLTLQTTGILPQHVHHFLSLAPSLLRLSITEIVPRSFPLTPVPALASLTLETLHYEITAPSTSSSLTPAVYGTTPVSLTQGYYTYLASSLHANALPRLRKLYVRDSTFPENLILVPPVAPFLAAEQQEQQLGGFNQQLEVYSKGLDELEWNFTHVKPPAGPGKRGSFAPMRPVSSYSVGAGMGFGGDGGGGGNAGGLSVGRGGGQRRSVVVGNGFGGFLAVPGDEAGRGGGGGDGGSGGGGWPSPVLVKKGSRTDLWR